MSNTETEDISLLVLKMEKETSTPPQESDFYPDTTQSASNIVCRICHTSNLLTENLISPCHCKGSLAYVHLSCLERWLNESGRIYCELCLYRFNSISRQRYKIFESLRLWCRQPRQCAQLKSDIIIVLLLTLITAGLISVCLIGMEYFAFEGVRFGITKRWTRGGLIVFLGIVLCGYLATLYLLIKDQFVPWYNWWRRAIDVRVRLTPSAVRNTVANRLECHIN